MNRQAQSLESIPSRGVIPTGDAAELINLGHLAPDVAFLDRLVRLREEAVYAEPYLTYQEQLDRIPMTYTAYLRASGNFAVLARDERRRQVAVEQIEFTGRDNGRLHILGREDDLTADFIARGENPEFTPDFDGWLRYLETKGPFRADLKRHRQPALFHQSGREENTLVVAPTKWGKSELLKALAWHYIAPAEPPAAVVILDPGGDLVRQIARWPELSGPLADRLIYIEPDLTEGLSVGLNPLDGRGMDHRTRNHAAGMIAAALGETAAELTPAMQTLTRHCATVLMSVEGSTLRDLLHMLRDPKTDPRAGEFLRLGLTYPDPDVQEFFAFEFNGEGYAGTKHFLRNRLNKLLSITDFAGIFAGRTTVNLTAAVEARKVVLVNLYKLEDEDGIATAGRLLVAMVGAIGRRRGQHPDAPRIPVHLFVDEVTTMVSNEMVRMLAQLRKWGIHQTLAQQVGGAGFTAEQKATLTINTGCKFVGGLDQKLFADLLNLSGEAAKLPTLDRRQFWMHWPERGGPFMLNVRDDLAGYSRAVSPSRWAEFTAKITGPDGYYRPTKEAQQSRPAAGFEASPIAPEPTTKRRTKQPEGPTLNLRTPRPSKGTKRLPEVPLSAAERTLD